MSEREIGGEVPVGAFRPGSYQVSEDILDDEVFSTLVAAARDGIHKYVHFGLPCSSWSVIHHSNGGTRTLVSPHGDGSRANEIEGNRMASRVVKICHTLNRAGCFFSI